MNKSQLEEIEERVERASGDYTGTAVRVLVNTDTPALVAEVRRLQAALEWYANQDNYYITTCVSDDICTDGGQRARAALRLGDE
jgi:hypothetical protein